MVRDNNPLVGGIASGVLAGSVGAAFLGPVFGSTTLAIAACSAAGALASVSLSLGPNRNYDRLVLNDHAMVSIVNLSGEVLSANRNFCAVTGYKEAELLGQLTYRRLYFQDDRALFTEIRDEISQGRNWSGETRLRARDGSEIWTRTTIIPRRNWLGQITSALIVRTDTTEGRKAKSLADLVKMLDNLSEEVGIFDSRDGTIEYLNHTGLKMFGLDAAQLGRIRLAHLSIDYDRQLVKDMLKPLVEGDEEKVDFVISLGGTPFDVRVQKIEVDSEVCKLIAVFRDRTSQEAIDAEKSQFVSTVSHELRTPLTSIKGALGLILSREEGGLDQKSRDLLSIAQRNAERLVLIVNDILDLEKMDAGQMPFNLEWGDLRVSVKEALVQNAPLMNELGVMSAMTGKLDQPLMMHIDAGRMAQVLNNLMSNAAKFSKTGEKVTVDLWQRDDEVGFSVIDRGIGIPQPAIETIFERFRQVERKNRPSINGTGLGLAIVETIVERHKGRVWIESVEGQGTQVHCAFPRAASDEIGHRASA